MSKGKTAEARILDAYDRMDSVEQIIFLGAVRALSEGVITPEQFEERTHDLFRRHRAGEDLTTTDLDCIRLG